MLRTIFIILVLSNLCFSQKRIIGGKSVQIKDYPYQLSLQFYGRHNCGASIISKNWAVTAAHCFENGQYPWLYEVRAGSSYHAYGGTLVGLKSIKIHPQYNRQTLDYDVAVFEFSRSLVYGPEIQKIELATSLPPDGTMLVATGWGRTSNYDTSIPTQLQSVELPLQNMDHCKLNHAVKFVYLTDRQICAGAIFGAGKGICNGDSGGPLSYNNELVGISSAVAGQCAQFFGPSIFANVPHLAEFIKKNVEFDS